MNRVYEPCPTMLYSATLSHCSILPHNASLQFTSPDNAEGEPRLCCYCRSCKTLQLYFSERMCTVQKVLLVQKPVGSLTQIQACILYSPDLLFYTGGSLARVSVPLLKVLLPPRTSLVMQRSTTGQMSGVQYDCKHSN